MRIAATTKMTIDQTAFVTSPVNMAMMELPAVQMIPVKISSEIPLDTP